MIHLGTSPNGQIAIQVCQQMSCNIFVTASSDEERQFLEDEFGIRPGHILDPSDANLADQLLFATSNSGVDVVLDSMSNRRLNTSAPIVRNYGRYIEIDNHDSQPNSQVSRNTHYYNISSILTEDAYEIIIPKLLKEFKKWFNYASRE